MISALDTFYMYTSLTYTAAVHICKYASELVAVNLVRHNISASIYHETGVPEGATKYKLVISCYGSPIRAALSGKAIQAYMYGSKTSKAERSSNRVGVVLLVGELDRNVNPPSMEKSAHTCGEAMRKFGPVPRSETFQGAIRFVGENAFFGPLFYRFCRIFCTIS